MIETGRENIGSSWIGSRKFRDSWKYRDFRKCLEFSVSGISEGIEILDKKSRFQERIYISENFDNLIATYKSHFNKS